ncbi:MAG: hypothetical protein QOK71_04490 [Nitrososphaeraceae archaeon]|nr:hypothetical protein [Nitrososphaeraceae archaeon]
MVLTRDGGVSLKNGLNSVLEPTPGLVWFGFLERFKPFEPVTQ